MQMITDGVGKEACEMTSLLIKNGLLVTMNSKKEIFQGDILVVDGIIKEIDSDIPEGEHLVLDATSQVVIPGLIQPHVHLTQTLFRGIADDLELMDWLKDWIWPLEGLHSHESNYCSAMLGIAELIKGGTTSVMDMGTVHHTEAIFQAAQESGFRLVGGKCMMDHGKKVPGSLFEKTHQALDESRRLIKKWHGSAGGRIHYALAPRFVVSCTETLLRNTLNLSREYGVKIHTHASENREEIRLVEKRTGMRNIHYLDHLGILNSQLVLAHCIWLEENEMNRLSESGTHVVHCPSSNMKLASGIAKIPELLNMGVHLSLAADGAPCNNNLDMFREMRHAALIHKARLMDATTMTAEDVFEMATRGGAKALGRERDLGSLEAGKKADVVLIDRSSPHHAPATDSNLFSWLVYSACASDVNTTIIDGRIVMRKRVLQTINEIELVHDSREMISHMLTRLNGNTS